MKTAYTYVPSGEYIDSLVFEYMETWSFQRGQAYEDDLKENKLAYVALQSRKKKTNDLSLKDEQWLNKAERLYGMTQYLLDQDGLFHRSAQKTNTFYVDAPEIVVIKQILKTEITGIPRWLCAPFYRDAIVFYNKDGAIVSTLNVCLSCMYMETKMFSHVDADYQTYDLLKRFFTKAGHEVERPDHFIMDEINRLKEKHLKGKE